MKFRRALSFGLIGISFFWNTSCKKTAETTQSATPFSVSFSTVDSTISGSPTTGIAFGTVAPNGALYITGYSSGKLLTRKSSDQGSTWTTVDNFSSTSQGLGIAADSAGRLFSVGTYNSGGYRGLIRRSTDDGATWSTVYSSQISGSMTTLTAVSVDASDRIFVAGYAKPAGLLHFVVLKSVDHGTSWTQVDDYVPDGFNFGHPGGILVSSSGKLYVWSNTMSNGDGTQIRVSSDNGATWRTIYQAWGRQIGGLVDWSDGLVMTETITSTSPTTWQIVGTNDDFSHVKVMEAENPSGSTGAHAGQVKVDSRGYMYLIGYYTDASYQPVVNLLGTRGDGTFTTLDQFPSDSNYSAYDSGIFFDNSTGVYYVAQISDATTTTWAVRKGTVTDTATYTPAAIETGTDLQNVIPSGAKRLFVSTTTHSAVFGVSQAAAITAADAICNADASKPVGSSTYKALMVNTSRVACTTPFCSGGTSEHTDWVLAANTQYVRTDGTSIGTTNSNGLFTAFDNKISQYNQDLPWVGLSYYLDWTVQTDDPDNANLNCNGWISTDGYAGAWAAFESDFSWVYSTAYPNLCTETHSLICVEQ